MSIATEGALSAAPQKHSLTKFDIAFGIVLPIICFAVDLSFMRISRIAPFAFLGVAALGIFALILARFKTSSAFGDIILGMLGASAIVAGVIGVALAYLIGFFLLKSGLQLPSFSSVDIFFFGIYIGFAFLGLVPLLTAKVFYNHTVRLAKRPGKRNTFLIAVGALVFTLPLAAHYVEYRWLNPHLAALSGNNREMRLNALRALNNYPFTFGRAKGYACGIVRHDASIDEPTMRELEIMIGPYVGSGLGCSLP